MTNNQSGKFQDKNNSFDNILDKDFFNQGLNADQILNFNQNSNANRNSRSNQSYQRSQKVANDQSFQSNRNIENSQPNKNNNVKLINRYDVLELNDISSVVFETNVQGIKQEDTFVFYPLAVKSKILYIKIPYGKFENLRLMPYKKDIKFDYNKKTLRLRYLTMGVIYYYSSKDNFWKSRIGVIPFSSQDSMYIMQTEFFNKYKLGSFVFRFFLTGKYRESLHIISQYNVYSNNSEQVNSFKKIVSVLIKKLEDYGWIKYDDYTFNAYTYYKSMPNYDFDKYNPNDWDLLLKSYLLSIGFQKQNKNVYNFRKKEPNKEKKSNSISNIADLLNESNLLNESSQKKEYKNKFSIPEIDM